MSRLGVECGNERHPLGAWHPAGSLAASWEWRKRIVHWWRRRTYGCTCPPHLTDSEVAYMLRPTGDEKP